jgi:DNA-binding HxlR family transcriptional regulator
MIASDSKAANRTPLPGHPVRGSRTGRPAMALLDLLGRRWALRVLWELRGGDPLTFRELQVRCGNISSSVLNQRLRELRDAGTIALQTGGYLLTGDGHELMAALAPLEEWANRWAARSPAEGPGRSSA